MLAFAANSLLALAVLATGPRATQDADGETLVRGALAEKIDRYLSRCVPFGFSGSALVAAGDEVILSKGYGIADSQTGAACTPSTVFDLGSLTKQFTATAVLVLEQRGVLEVTDKLDRFLSDVPSDKAAIQVHQLLTHTSGLPRAVPRLNSEVHDREAMLKLVLAAPLSSKPGREHLYSNAGYELLGAVVEVAAKKPFEELLRELLFDPAGMGSTGFRQDGRLDPSLAARGRMKPDDPPPPGSLLEGRAQDEPRRPGERTLATEGWYSWGLRGAGGVLSTAPDLWRWERALRGDDVLTKASKKKLFTPVRGDYAYGWYALKTKAGKTWIEHGGSTDNGFDVKCTRYPDDGIFFVVLGNGPGVVPWVNLNVGKLIQGEPCDLPPATTSLAESELEALTGEYEGPKGLRLRAFAHSGALFLEAGSEAAFKLLAGDASTAGPKGELRLSRKIADGFATADFRALHEAEDERYPLFFMESWWQSLLAHHGALRRATVLGASAERGGGVTVAALVEFERGSENFRLQWSGGKLAGVNIGPPYPNRLRLAPKSAQSFVAYDLVRQKVLARASRPTSTGTGLELEVGGEKARLVRAKD
jgi:CubicO group peptidase (beta-lactamase class C family)